MVWLIMGVYIKPVQVQAESYPSRSAVCTGGIMKCLVALLVCAVFAEGIVK